MLTKELKIDKSFCMKGFIRTKEKCPKCRGAYTGPTLTCSTCLTAPKRYYIDIYQAGYGKIKIYSDKSGCALDSFERAHRVLEALRYEIDTHNFDPQKYVASSIQDYLFENRIEGWYQSKLKEVEKNSLAASYTRKLKCYVDYYFLPFFKGTDIRDLKTFHIKNFYDQLPSGKSLKYIKNIITALENFFNTLMSCEYISQKPVFPKIQVDEKTPKWVDAETQLKILNLIPIEDRPIFAFLSYQGVRPGEAQALKKKDIHLNEQFILIARTFSNRKIRERVKNKVIRPRLINPVLVPMLGELCKDKLPEAFVFINPRTKRPYTEGALFRIWDKVRKELGINIKLYEGTRHSLASIAVNNKVPLISIRDVLGHTNISTTVKYSHTNLESQRVMFNSTENSVQLFSQTGPKEAPIRILVQK